MVNALSFDIEDYYQIVARDWLNQQIPVTDRVVENTQEILAILDQFKVKATFFVVGHVAKTFPDLLKEIDCRGHELGLHGNRHLLINTLNATQFSDEIAKNIENIFNACGIVPKCHRAPAFSLGFENEAAFGVLLRHGITLDSSLFPFSGSRYGSDQIPRSPFKIQLRNQAIWELVLATTTWNNKHIPVAGGGYLRIMPFGWTKSQIEKINAETLPATVYFHSYEIDHYHNQFISLGGTELKDSIYFRWQNFKQHIRRGSCKPKLLRLLESFQFSTCSNVIETWQKKGQDVSVAL
jgi:polysaccharide deacetylase family protein (PEP-CTERM system associated)